MPRRSKTVVAWLCVGAVALIAYGSLYPFDFEFGGNAPGLLQALGQLSWARAGRSDRIANLLLYVPLGFCLTLWLEGRARDRIAVLAATVCGATLSLCIEIAQVFIASRVPSFLDVAFNTGGALGGAVGGVAWRALSARLPSAVAEGTARGGKSDRGGSIVLLLWLATHWAPFVPHFTLGKLKAALQPLFDPTASWAATTHYLVWWMVVAQIVFVLASTQRGVEMLVAAIAVVQLGHLFVVDQAFVPSELIALVVLLPLLVLLHWLRATMRRAVLLCAFAAIFIYDRLAPFNSTGAPAFELWPFLAWIDAGLPLQLPALFKSLFEFAALAWLIKEAGGSLRMASVIVPAGVFGLEVLAMWTHGHAGSITAPLLALCMCLLLRYAGDQARRGALIPQRARSR